MAKLAPQQLNARIRALEIKEEERSETIKVLERQVDYLKDVVLKVLENNHPDFKKKKALNEVDDFLRKRFGT